MALASSGGHCPPVMSLDSAGRRDWECFKWLWTAVGATGSVLSGSRQLLEAFQSLLNSSEQRWGGLGVLNGSGQGWVPWECFKYLWIALGALAVFYRALDSSGGYWESFKLLWTALGGGADSGLNGPGQLWGTLAVF